MKNQDEINFHKEKILKFVSDSLCKRPAMWVGVNDFEKLVHFYDGYTTALQTHLGIDLYRGWNYWLADELEPQFTNHAWWSIMLEYYKTDEQAIENFPKLLKKYLYSKEFDDFSKADDIA